MKRMPLRVSSAQAFLFKRGGLYWENDDLRVATLMDAVGLYNIEQMGGTSRQAILQAVGTWAPPIWKVPIYNYADAVSSLCFGSDDQGEIKYPRAEPFPKIQSGYNKCHQPTLREFKRLIVAGQEGFAARATAWMQAKTAAPAAAAEKGTESQQDPRNAPSPDQDRGPTGNREPAS